MNRRNDAASTFRKASVSILLLTALAFPGFGEEAKKAVPLGTREEAKWTPTTLEAAGAAPSPFLKQLEAAKVATVIGEVIDMSCYLQLGKRGEKHIACGAKCVKNGQPAAILDDEGNLTLLVAEQHHPRRDGEVSLADKLSGLMGQRVVATGMLSEVRGSRALFVQAPSVAAAMPATAAAAPQN